jgi:hypothetical protein
MLRRLSTLFCSMALAIVAIVALATPASAAPTADVRFYLDIDQVRGHGTEYSGTARSVCVVLYRGVPIPFRSFNWSPVASRCVDRVTNYAGVSISTPAVSCYSAMYYARTTTYTGSGGTGGVVAQKYSATYSVVC